MTQQKDPEALAQELIVKMDAMIEEAEQQSHQTDELYRELGIERGFAGQFLESGKLPANEKEKIEKEMAEWQEEVERDIREEQERFKLESRPGKPPKMKKNRNMV